MTVETISHISEFQLDTVGDDTDPVEGGAQVNLVKTVLKTDFGNVAGAVTASHTDLNTTDVTTLGTAAASKVLTADGSANINAGALTWTDAGTMTSVDVNGGTIDGTIIGGSSAAAGTFTNATITTADINGGNIDGTVIGASSAVAGTFSGLTLSGAIAMATNKITGLGDPTSDQDAATKAWVLTKSIYNFTRTVAIGSEASKYIPIPASGEMIRLDTCQNTTFAGNSTITVYTSGGAEMASVTVTGSVGDVETDSTILNASVTAGDYIRLHNTAITAGGDEPITVVITIQQS